MNTKMDEIIEKYILDHSDSESELLYSLRRAAHIHLLRPRMISGHLQGRILKMFCRMMQPKRVLEIGTYTGYATICMAEALADDALIHTIEVNDELEDFILNYFEQSKDKNKMKLHIGDFDDVFPKLNEIFDLVFIDADKRQYIHYFDTVFNYVRPGGLILADNTLWSGKIVEEAKHNDTQTIELQKFNDKIKLDPRVEKVILPLRDGLTMIWKK